MMSLFILNYPACGETCLKQFWWENKDETARSTANHLQNDSYNAR